MSVVFNVNRVKGIPKSVLVWKKKSYLKIILNLCFLSGCNFIEDSVMLVFTWAINMPTNTKLGHLDKNKNHVFEE